MIAIDANLLIYAYNAAVPEYGPARAWLEAAFAGPEPVGIPLVSVLAFLRISTNRRLLEIALTPPEASAVVRTWFARDNVTLLSPGPSHWPMFLDLLVDAGATGARVTDAHLAALAIEHGATLCTNDRDFRAFPRLKVRFPIDNAGD